MEGGGVWWRCEPTTHLLEHREGEATLVFPVQIEELAQVDHQRPEVRYFLCTVVIVLVTHDKQSQDFLMVSFDNNTYGKNKNNKKKVYEKKLHILR